MKTIFLTQGKVALVDDEDFERLNAHKWFAEKGKITFYALRQSPRIAGKQKKIRMHWEVLGREADHKNGDGLDNRKENLRAATSCQNSMNRRKRADTFGKFKGVHWNIQHKKWCARVTIAGKRKHLGYFDCELDAARAYDAAAKKAFREFARPNFVEA